MRINTNLTAMNTYAQYTKNQGKISSAVAKLSSGYAINTAADNAAGLAISEKMRAQIHGLDKASANAQDAISLVQSAEGALSSSTEILQRMREIAVQSSSDTNNNEIDRTALQDEFKQLQTELNDISKNTTFNKKNLLDGSLASSSRSVNVTKLANAKTAISIGEAEAGGYNFTVSTKQETSAVDGHIAAATASKGTTASATIASVSAQMNNTTEKTALYNGNYSLSTKVDAATGSITVLAKGDNGQSFTTTLSKADMTSQTDLKLNFETTTGAKDAFTVSLNLKESADPTSENSLKTLATAINDVTVSVDKGMDTVDATYGVYANITGGESVKLKAGDSSVTFDNGVTVSFDKLTATDVAVNSNKADVLAETKLNADITIGTGVTSTVSMNFSGLFDAGLTSGEEFGITIGDQTYTGTYKGETGTDLEKLISNTIGSATIKSDQGTAMTLSMSGTTATWAMTGTETAGGITLNGKTLTADGTGAVSFSEPGAGTTVGAAGTTYTNGTVSTAASFTAPALVLNTDWGNATAGDTVYFQLGDTVYSGTLQAGGDQAAMNNTLASMLNGASYTDKNNVTYTFSGINTNQATFTATTIGTTVNPNNIVVKSGTVGTGNKATLSDGLADKIGTSNDKGSSSTTATTFNVTSKARDGVTFQVGANEGDEMMINIEKVDSQSLGVNSARVDTQDAAKSAVTAVDKAINKVSSQRAALGAVQNRLQYKIDNLNTSSTNLTAAESQIRDVDMAKEMTEFTNANILSQAATAMLAQANSLPQSVLSLIGK